VETRVRTSTALLESLLESRNEPAWSELDRRYRPLVFALARRLRLEEADAADAAQETMLRVLEDYRRGRYDRERGSLGAWVLAIARQRIADLRRERFRRRDLRGESAIASLPGEDELSELWNVECRRVLLERATLRLQHSGLKERTVRAFELVAREGQDAREAAVALDMTRDEVYVAKHRVLSKLREISNELRELWEL